MIDTQKPTKLSSRFAWINRLNAETGINEGTVRKFFLSKNFSFKLNKNKESSMQQLVILRPLIDDSSYYNAVTTAYCEKFPYCKGDPNLVVTQLPYKLTDAAKSRLAYPGIEITKTVDAYHGATIAPGGKLIYSISIKNNSDKAYSMLPVIENLSEYVSATEIHENGKLDSTGKTISWTIGSIPPGSTHIINYTVTVKGDALGKEIQSTGYVDKIESGSVINYVANDLTSAQVQKLSKAFNTNKTKYSGRELIQKVYSDALGYEIDLKNLKLGKLYPVAGTLVSGSDATSEANRKELKNHPYYQDTYEEASSLLTSYYRTSWLDIKLETKHPLAKMVYHHYYSAVYTNYVTPVSTNPKTLSVYAKYFSKQSKQEDKRSDRSVMVSPELLRDGDILLFDNLYDTDLADPKTFEKGSYGFIYLDGKFQGVNKIYPKTNEEKDFNEFLVRNSECNKNWSEYQQDVCKTYGDLYKLYGKDFYVILRPSLVMNNK